MEGIFSVVRNERTLPPTLLSLYSSSPNSRGLDISCLILLVPSAEYYLSITSPSSDIIYHMCIISYLHLLVLYLCIYYQLYAVNFLSIRLPTYLPTYLPVRFHHFPYFLLGHTDVNPPHPGRCLSTE